MTDAAEQESPSQGSLDDSRLFHRLRPQERKTTVSQASRGRGRPTLTCQAPQSLQYRQNPYEHWR